MLFQYALVCWLDAVIEHKVIEVYFVIGYI